MTDVRFYHLVKTAQDSAIPQIAYKAWQAGHRIVLKAANDAEVARLNTALWTFRPEAFLPHGSKEDGRGERQPVWLTTGDDNPNGAKTLILAAGCTSDSVGAYDVCCAMLDGNDQSQVEQARALWKSYKEAGHSVSYWQQTDTGWEKKA